MAAGRKKHGLRRQLASGLHEPHVLRTGEYCAITDDLSAGALERADIGCLETRNLLVLVGDKRRPVEAGVNMPAEAFGDLELILEARGVDEELLGHAPADHAGAADAIFLDDGDLCAEVRCKTRCAHTAG